jgi:hypothetical protein
LTTIRIDGAQLTWKLPEDTFHPVALTIAEPPASSTGPRLNRAWM